MATPTNEFFDEITIKMKTPLPKILKPRVLTAMAAAVALTGCAVQPKPLTLHEQVDLTRADLKAIFDKQAPVTASLTLHEAMARALKYNLDHRLKLMEQAVSVTQMDTDLYAMLPRLTASAGYVGRSNDNLVLNSSGGVTSVNPSLSQDQERNYGDLSFSWNLLDFGASYYTAKQNADQYLITQERRRKVLHNLMQEVRLAFWDAYSAQQLLPRLDPIIERAEMALENSRRSGQKQLQNPLVTMRYQRQLLNNLRQLESLKNDMHRAINTLQGLVNLRPGSKLQLVAGEQSIPSLSLTPDQLEKVSLLNRPELREEFYRSRISHAETRKAVLRLLPGLELAGGGHHDSNSYLVNQQWGEVSALVSWNLMNIFSGPARIELAEKQAELDHLRRLAMQMAVMTQARLSWYNYETQRAQLIKYTELTELDERIEQHLRTGRRHSVQSELEEIQASVNAVLSRLLQDRAHSELQHAVGQIYATLGLDPLPGLQDDSLEAVSNGFKQQLDAWHQGRFELPSQEILDQLNHDAPAAS